MFDSHAAQQRNPHSAGTYRDTAQAKAERLARYSQRDWRSPLYTRPGLPAGRLDTDGAFRRHLRPTTHQKKAS